MSKPKRYLSVNVEQADKQILSLFPSINFQGEEVDKQRKKGMKTCLRVLCIAADKDFVSRYMLTKKYEFGGDSINRALERLERLELLKAMPPKLTSKKVGRIDYVLTVKGLIACMSLPRFQQVQQLYRILLKFSDDTVARTLILLNWLSESGDGTQISVAVRYIRKLSEQGVNVEQKSEDSIYRDLLTIDEIRIAKTLDPILETLKETIPSLTPENGQVIGEELIDVIKMATSDPELFKIAIDLMRESFFLFLCPEFQAWFRTKPSSEDMKRMFDTCKKITLSVVTREFFFGLLEENKDSQEKISRLILKLRELFASEVTRKIEGILNSLRKNEKSIKT